MKLCLSKEELEAAIRVRYPVPAGFAFANCEINPYKTASEFCVISLDELPKPEALEPRADATALAPWETLEPASKAAA
jgi:hypothetical protein